MLPTIRFSMGLSALGLLVAAALRVHGMGNQQGPFLRVLTKNQLDGDITAYEKIYSNSDSLVTFSVPKNSGAFSYIHYVNAGTTTLVGSFITSANQGASCSATVNLQESKAAKALIYVSGTNDAPYCTVQY